MWSSSQGPRQDVIDFISHHSATVVQRTTIARKLSAVRALYRFLLIERADADPCGRGPPVCRALAQGADGGSVGGCWDPNR